jgi:hypothetical protein
MKSLRQSPPGSQWQAKPRTTLLRSTAMGAKVIVEGVEDRMRENRSVLGANLYVPASDGKSTRLDSPAERITKLLQLEKVGQCGQNMQRFIGVEGEKPYA